MKRPQEGANVIDRTGQQYGKLIVVGRAGSRGGYATWRCRCDCGGEKIVLSSSLRGGYAKSCGCSRKTGLGSRPNYVRTAPHRPCRPGRDNVLAQYQRAARDRGLSWDIDGAVFDGLIAAKCTYCGIPPSTVSRAGRRSAFAYTGIDRIDNRLGYVFGNVVACCSVCNHAKATMPQATFLAWIDRLVAHTGTRDNLCRKRQS